MLFQMHNGPLLVQKNKVDREEHPYRVHATRRDNPKPTAEFGPALGFPQQTNQAAEVVIRNHRLSGHKRFPRLVIHVDVSAEIAVTARHQFSVNSASMSWRRLRPYHRVGLVDRLTLTTPNND